MKRSLRVVQLAGLVGGVVAGLAGGAVWSALRRPLPRSGQLQLPGLHAPVEVIRDRWGVPHLYAQTNEDLFAAQGYVHAQDRLWQMEFQRRLGHGRLSELFGPQALETDRFCRILGFGRAARTDFAALDAESNAVLAAYARGVNALITAQRRRLPLEFQLLRCEPEPWTPVDTLVWGKVMALGLSENWAAEILHARIVALVGTERAAALLPRYPQDHPTTVPPARYQTNIGEAALRGAAALNGYLPHSNGEGSNAWVVSAARSSNGHPLLADDPHLAIAAPSVWYENHLHGGDYHVTGASFPGTPGVVIGHNENIAWGVTNVMADVQDLYIERFDPADPTRYLTESGWQQAEVIIETIRIKGQSAPEHERVVVTRHGPVIDRFVSDGDLASGALALRWTAYEPGSLVRAVLNLNRATDWDSFRAALADWTCPPQNFVYADAAGHIGYSTGGMMPIRRNWNGKLPVPGWDGTYEWDGFIPNAELPHVLDPAAGALVTANNRIVEDTYPHPFHAAWLNGYRAARIGALLDATPHHDRTSFASIHADQLSLPGRAFAQLAERLPANSSTALIARAALATWDGVLNETTIGGTIYARLREHLLKTVYAKVMAASPPPIGLGAFAQLPLMGYLERALPEVLSRCQANDDAWLGDGRTWDEVLAHAWDATIADLRAELGPDVATWRYGRWHTATFGHPLGAVPALARLFNRGPLPRGGDLDTVNMGHKPRFPAGPPSFTAPSYRHIITVGDWEHCWSVHAPGQSGQPGSHHYDDLLALWRATDYHPMPWSRTAVEVYAETRMTLSDIS